MFRPESVNILGKTYRIIYVDNPAEVDWQKRRSLWGQIDYWTRTIRVYDNQRGDDDRLDAILHEVLHHLDEHLDLGLGSESEEHKKIELLSVALADVLLRNGWMAK